MLAAGKITNVCEPYFAPYEFIDNTKSGQEQFRGADMELARYIAKELGVELEIVPLEWSAVLTGVGAGKYDMAVAGMAYTPERAETMAMSKVYKPGGGSGSAGPGGPRWMSTPLLPILPVRRWASRAAPCRSRTC